MTITELIAALQRVPAEYGDAPVFLHLTDRLQMRRHLGHAIELRTESLPTGQALLYLDAPVNGTGHLD